MSRVTFGLAPADPSPSVVINKNGARVDVQSTQMTTDSNGQRRLEITVGETVAQALNRPQGRAAMQNGYGIKPKLTLY